MKRRILTCLLLLSMLMSLLPMAAFAEELPGELQVEDEEFEIEIGEVSVSEEGMTLNADQPDLVWQQGADGKYYWYENGAVQGTYSDPQGVIGDGTVRGREIFDPASNGWYWLDACYNGAKAVGKEVWMPYVYQGEASWDDAEKEANANTSGAMSEQVLTAIQQGTGKWVRYDDNGAMCKGWCVITGALAEVYPDQTGNTYYYDPQTGLMAKGTVTIDGINYYFDETTGVLQEENNLPAADDSGSSTSKNSDSGSNAAESINSTDTVYVSNAGKIHTKPNCSGMKQYSTMTLSEALSKGYEKCKKCFG